MNIVFTLQGVLCLTLGLTFCLVTTMQNKSTYEYRYERSNKTNARNNDYNNSSYLLLLWNPVLYQAKRYEAYCAHLLIGDHTLPAVVLIILHHTAHAEN